MATQIVILREDTINVDDGFIIEWADKGKNWQDTWVPNTIHAVVYNNKGPNEIQTIDPSTKMMAGNTNLTATTNAVGNTTIADLLTWAEIRKTQIEEAYADYAAAVSSDATNGTDTAVGKTWKDFDPNYS